MPLRRVRTSLRASIHQRLSLDVRFLEGLDAAEEHARAAVDLAEQLGDAALRASALGGLALIELNAGRPGALELGEQAYELVRGREMSQAVADVAFPFAHVLLWSAHFDRARTLLESLHADWSERDERMAAYALWYLSMVELRTGNYALAEQHARQSRQLNGSYVREEVASPTSLFPLTLIAAHRGDLVRARELAEETCRLAELHATRLHGPLTTLGIVELWSGSPAAAVECFRAADEMTDGKMSPWRASSCTMRVGMRAATISAS